MTDYINREDAIKVIVDYAVPQMYFPNGGDLEAVGECAKRVLNNAPSQDVAPIRHGHWIKISPAGIYECSECGKNVMTSDIEVYEYCHGCGARMDEEVD